MPGYRLGHSDASTGSEQAAESRNFRQSIRHNLFRLKSFAQKDAAAFPAAPAPVAMWSRSVPEWSPACPARGESPRMTGESSAASAATCAALHILAKFWPRAGFSTGPEAQTFLESKMTDLHPQISCRG